MNRQPETILIASVGTTIEPIQEALRTAKEEGALAVFLVYGRALPGQGPTPFSVANTIYQKATELGIPSRVFELDEPENLDRSLEVCRRVLAEASALGASRIVIDFTGGTKVMGASLVHIALDRQWGADIVFQYVGGARNEYGRVKEMVLQRAPHTIIEEAVSRTLDCLRQQEYARALGISEGLLQRGKTNFLRIAALILWHWDNFHYREAFPLIKECVAQAKVLTDDTRYSILADTIVRLHRAAGRIELALKILNKLQEGGSPSLPQEAAQGWLFILGDTIANAERKVSSSPADSVLRAYRAAEIATQLGLVRLGINPWQPDWSKLTEAQRSSYLGALGNSQLPHQLTLKNGLRLIEAITSPLPQETGENITHIMSERNFSYLEHGYRRVSRETAQKILVKMKRVVPCITRQAGIREDPLEYGKELTLRA